MLVLALQFSRCEMTHAEHPQRGARRSGVAEVYRTMSSSLKTEEKTVTVDDLTREEGPNP